LNLPCILRLTFCTPSTISLELFSIGMKLARSSKLTGNAENYTSRQCFFPLCYFFLCCLGCRPPQVRYYFISCTVLGGFANDQQSQPAGTSLPGPPRYGAHLALISSDAFSYLSRPVEGVLSSQRWRNATK